MDVYSRMTDEDANDYTKLKEALLIKYKYTEDGFREKFKKCKPEKNETPEQFIYRIKNYFTRWIELSSTE